MASSAFLRFDGAVDRDPAIAQWLDAQPAELGRLARQWFARMQHCGVDVRELMHDGCPTACVEDAAFGYVCVFRNHVNVGFFHGTSLPDPMGMLEGTGKRMRHAKLRPGVTVNEAALDALITAAYHDIVRRLASAEDQADAATSTNHDTR